MSLLEKAGLPAIAKPPVIPSGRRFFVNPGSKNRDALDIIRGNCRVKASKVKNRAGR